MAFFLNKNLVFFWQYASYEKLVNNLTDDDFKYSTEELGSKNFELLKQKRCLPSLVHG